MNRRSFIAGIAAVVTLGITGLAEARGGQRKRRRKRAARPKVERKLPDPILLDPDNPIQIIEVFHSVPALLARAEELLPNPILRVSPMGDMTPEGLMWAGFEIKFLQPGNSSTLYLQLEQPEKFDRLTAWWARHADWWAGALGVRGKD